MAAAGSVYRMEYMPNADTENLWSKKRENRKRKESICISAQFAPTLKKIADGQAVELNIELADDEVLENIAGLLNESILMLVPTEE